MNSTVSLSQITLAAVRTSALVDFYNAVFEANLVPVEGYDEFDGVMYRGMLGGVPFLICPNEIAGVNAQQARHQLHLSVSDVGATVAHAEEMGGAVLEQTQDDGTRTVTIRDPDNNTLVLTGRAG